MAEGLFKVIKEFDVVACVDKIIASEELKKTLGANLTKTTITPPDLRVRTTSYIIQKKGSDDGFKASIWHNQDYSPPVLKIEVNADEGLENQIYQTIISILGLDKS